MKVYESLEEIETDLRVYDLQRKIAMEEAKSMGVSLRPYEVSNSLMSNSLLKAGLRLASRWGLRWALKKILR